MASEEPAEAAVDEREVYAYVRWADGGCVARYVNNPFHAARWPMLQGLPDPGLCRGPGGEVRSPHDEGNLTREHVKDANAHAMSLRAVTDRDHVVVMCWGHHVFGRQWCTMAVVREAILAYIAKRNSLHPERRLAV